MSATSLGSSREMSQSPERGDEAATAVDLNLVWQLCSSVEQSVPQLYTNLGLLAPGEVTATCEHLLELLCVGTLPQHGLVLAATALCTALTAVSGPPAAACLLGHCLAVPETRASLALDVGPRSLRRPVARPDSFKTALCHGVLHSRACADLLRASHGSALARAVFDHLRRHCASYSRFTHSAFRLMEAWLHQAARPESGTVHAVFSLVSANWENPVNGVRALNSRLLRALLDVCERGNYVLDEPCRVPLTAAALLEVAVRELPWHVKSKYYILEVVLRKYGARKALLQWPCLVEGLCCSLADTALVSAGTLVYRACLDDMSEHDWLRHFLGPVQGVMTAAGPSVSVQQQNLFGYWILPTLKKFPSLLVDLLSHLTADPTFVHGPAALFAVVALLRVGQKEGARLAAADLGSVDMERVLGTALGHGDPVVRSEGVGLLCASLGTAVLRSDRVCDLLSVYLVGDSSTDNPQLRQCIVNSFISFLLRLRECCAQELKTQSSADLDVTASETPRGARSSVQSSLSQRFPDVTGRGILELSLCFFHWLRDFIVGNLEPGCNYQRKTLSLQLLKSVLLYVVRPDCLSRERGAYQQKKSNNQACSGARLLAFLAENKSPLFDCDEMRSSLLKCILDETDDIRVMAGDVLTRFFSLSAGDDREERSLFRMGMNLCKGSMFYTAESGALLLQVVVAWLDAGAPERAAGLVSEFLEHGYEEWCEPGDGSGTAVASRPTTVAGLLLLCAEQQGSCLRRDLATAAMHGAPLHGLLATLAVLVSRLTPQEVDRLVSLAEMSVDHLLGALSGKSASDTGTSPSFAEMMAAIEEQIASSTEDCLHISAAHQTVLSCIWLNLKACCDVASAVAGLGSERQAACCARLVVGVLARCRHKGAMEAAGRALGCLVAGATSRGDAASEVVLEEFLGHLKGSAGSVTRRSAGLAVLVHRLAVGDRLPDKSLLRRALAEVMGAATGPVAVSGPEHQECPEARALHLLRPLVLDASLWQHLAPHAPAMARLCLARLACPRWPVRNAALLLFGALIPKVVGKTGGAVEDFLCHYPELTDTLLQQLRSAATSRDAPGSHVMPALSLLSRLSFATESLADARVHATVLQFQRCYARLLSHRDHAVRRLSAQAYAGMVPHSRVRSAAEGVFSSIRRLGCGGKHRLLQNELHGMIMLARCLTERYQDGSRAMPQEEQLLLDLNAISNLPYLSWYNKMLMLDFGKEIQENILLARGNESYKINTLEAQTVAEDAPCVVKDVFEELSILTCSPDELPQLCCEKLRGEPGPSSSWFAALGRRLQNGRLARAVRTSVVCSLLLAISVDYSAPSIMSHVLAVLFSVLEDDDVDHLRLSQNESFAHLVSVLETEWPALRRCSTVAVAVMASLVSIQLEVCACPESAARLMSTVLKCVDEDGREVKQEDSRLYAAISLQTLTPSLRRLVDCGHAAVGRAFLRTALTLLQDESSSVRDTAAASVLRFRPESFCTGHARPYHCMRELVSVGCLEKLLPLEEAFDYFMSMFSCSEDVKWVCSVWEGGSRSSPFDHGESNIYKEECKTIEMIYSSIVDILHAKQAPRDSKWMSNVVKETLLSLEQHINTMFHALSITAEDLTKLSICYVKLHLILKKLNYQLLLVRQIEEISTCTREERGKTTVCCDLLHSLQRRLKLAVMPEQCQPVATCHQSA
ncbi:tRNA (32-2'-O)-methyltransferase regulator THADA [Bacillus rossius redtenbacheri]|uniref:tRNA (32-2'-O)-methyltransferase regulator THADA n=1 Tax=Bacillus rossius redtenbacheri TaxID=93214 RepID=UPI002FDC95F6